MWWHLDLLSLPPYRTEKSISFFISYLVCGFCFNSPNELRQGIETANAIEFQSRELLLKQTPECGWNVYSEPQREDF